MQVIGRCHESNEVCVPIEKYCDREADCPSASDEADCSCEEWNMISCKISGDFLYLCIYKEWRVRSDGTCEEMAETTDVEYDYSAQNIFGNCTTISEKGRDEPPCINSSSQHSCRTISYPLKWGVKIICILKDLEGGNEHVFIENVQKQGYHFENKKIVGNVGVSSLRGYRILIDSNLMYQMPFLIFVNLTIEDSAFHVRGEDLIFNSCILRNVLIRETLNSSEFIYVSITFENSTFICEGNKAAISLSEKTILKLRIFQGEINGCHINLSVRDLIFEVSESKIAHSSIEIEIVSVIRTLTVITFKKTNFNSSSLTYISQSYRSPLFDHYLRVEITDCSFERSYVYVQSGTSSILINNTCFRRGFKKGNGGALAIQTQYKKIKMFICQSHFEQNVAETGSAPKGFIGHGGALFLGYSGFAEGTIDLQIENCTFKNNFAVGIGASLYIGYGVKLYAFKCLFIYDMNTQYADFKAILYSLGKIERFQGDIIIRNAESKFYNGNYKILETEEAKTIEVSVQCPNWYVHNADFTETTTLSWFSVIKVIKELRYKCSPCSDGYYTISSNTQQFAYHNEKLTFGEQPEINSSRQDVKFKACIQCPYGATCPGNNIVPRQNYWGYWYEGELAFQACPAGYCCSGNDKAPCDRFNTCAGNRTGALCGACQEGFSISLLLGKCTPNIECQGNRWFWFLAVFMTMIYALWYTFKDDIFGFIFITLKFLGSPCGRKVKSKQIQPKSLPNNSVKEVDAQFMKDTKGSVDFEEDHTDKGYFGIVTYFVQMSSTMAIHIEFSEIDDSESFLDKVTENVGKFLGIQFSELSFDACPIVGLTTAGKNAFKFTFLLSIHVSWFILLKCGDILMYISEKRHTTSTDNIRKIFKLKMLRGFIEIMKYTYCGFCEIIFMSLVCVELGSDYVWWYDATNSCLENWQLLMVILGLIYAGPFPLALLTSMKMLKAQHISAWQFIICCLCQPIVLYHTIKYRRSSKKEASLSDELITDETRAIISVLQGPYREDAKSMTLYWEAMMSLRRLLITVMALIGTASIRMMFITGLCILFAMQHIYTGPFKAKQSNHVETLSLFLLSLVAVINLSKAILSDSGVIPTGPSVAFFKGLEFTEKVLLVILITYIMFIEIKENKKGQKTTHAKG